MMPDIKLPHLDRVEFYITNVCNLNCDDCNRLNNFYFSGHQYWKDFESVYEQWSQKISLKTITVLGGEPMLNPSLPDWLYGLRKLWPTSDIELLTNGTRIQYWPNLYKILLENKIELGVTVHNRSMARSLINDMENLLQHPIKKTSTANFNIWVNEYNKIKDPSWPSCSSIEDFDTLPKSIQDECRDVHKIDPETFKFEMGKILYQDANGVKAWVGYTDDFWSAPLKFIEPGSFRVYNSDPEKAHQVCNSKYCHHFIRGKLYKCHHVALLPEFMEQFEVDISPEDQQLLEAYVPLTVDQSLDNMHKFIDDLVDSIPQCKLCPSSIDSHPVFATTKKIKIYKKIKNTIMETNK